MITDKMDGVFNVAQKDFLERILERNDGCSMECARTKQETVLS